MFQFSAFAPITRYCLFKTVGCPIRIPVDQPLPAGPHHVSSLATSFFATRSHRHPPDALLLRTTRTLLIYYLLFSIGQRTSCSTNSRTWSLSKRQHSTQPLRAKHGSAPERRCSSRTFR